jgi:hypothetical protein
MMAGDGSEQHQLTAKFGFCRPEAPCRYHRDRANCAFHELPLVSDEEMNPERKSFRAEIGPELQRVSREIAANDAPPAGSWALVASQRLWLEEQLRDLYPDGQKTPVRHLIGGIASYVHLLGTLAIIQRVLADRPGARIEVIVCEPHAQAAEQAEKLGQLVTSDGWLRVLPTSWKKLRLSSEVKDAIKTIRRAGQIEVSALPLAIEDLTADSLPPVDIATEHFLTSMYEKDWSATAHIRAGYVRVLKPGGYLLSADGYSMYETGHPYAEFAEQHRTIGLEPLTGRARPVWDPYGHSREDHIGWAEAKRGSLTSLIAKGNTLSVFRKFDL